MREIPEDTGDHQIVRFARVDREFVNNQPKRNIARIALTEIEKEIGIETVSRMYNVALVRNVNEFWNRDVFTRLALEMFEAGRRHDYAKLASFVAAISKR